MSKRDEDRSLAISQHAVERFRERTGAHHLSDDECRRAIREALRHGIETPHHVSGQTVVEMTVLGVEVFAVIGADTTGWSRSGRAVATMLTREQVEFGARYGKMD